MPIEDSSLRLSCSHDKKKDNLSFFVLRNTNTSAGYCSRMMRAFCNDDYSSYKVTFGKRMIHLNIISLNREKDEDLWECLFRRNGETIKAELTVTVYTLPRGLLLSQGGNVKVDLTKYSLTVQCETNSCTYPAPVLSWYFKDMVQSSPRRFYNGSNTFKIETERGCSFPEQIYASYLHIPINSWWPENKYKTVLFSCGVEYPESSRNIFSPDSEKITFAVAVTSVYINVSTSTVVFYEGFSRLLTCMSSPSNPIPTIRWWLDYVQLNDSIVVTSSLNVEGLYTTISQISLRLKRVHRNSVIYCDAYIGRQEPVSSRQLSVDVWYQPSMPIVTEYGEANDMFPWFQNGTGTLQCYSSENGNPKSFVIWSVHRGVPNKEGNLIFTDLVPFDNGKEVACKLENNFTIDKHVQVASRPIRLNVEYYPNVEYNVISPMVVKETDPVSVFCESHGNPSPVSIRWGNGNNGSMLKFIQITRHNAGTYMCEAMSISQKYGPLKSWRKLDIIVQSLGEKKDQSDHVVVTILVLIAIGAAPVVFCVTIIAIVIVLSKRRRSRAKPQNGNMSEEDQVHGNDTRRNETQTADSNDIPNEYERLRRNVDEENQYIRLQNLSESSQDMDTRNDTLRKEIWTADNNDIPNTYEGQRRHVDEDI